MRELAARLGGIERSAERVVWVHGDDPVLFEAAERELRHFVAAHPRNPLRFTSSRSATLAVLRQRHPAGSVTPLPLATSLVQRRFLRHLRPRAVVLLEPCAEIAPSLLALLEARHFELLRVRAADLAAEGELSKRLGEIFARPRPPRKRSWPRSLEAGFHTSPLGRAFRTLRTRRYDLAALKRRLGDPATILCLGNGPSSEDPRLRDLPHDALLRVNNRWMERGLLTRPDMVFTGDWKSMQGLPPCLLGFRTLHNETALIQRSVLRLARQPIEYFCLERESDVLRDERWPARPTNGLSMLATACRLQPEHLIIAGIDLFAHPAGSYPGAPQTANEYLPVHDRNVELTILEHLLADFEGRITILGEPLQRALGYVERPARTRA